MYPISLHTLLKRAPESTRNNRNDNILIPNYRLNTSRNQFLYCGTITWNEMNRKVVTLQIKSLYDMSTSSCFAKKKFKEILLDVQSSGSIEHWEKHNHII